AQDMVRVWSGGFTSPRPAEPKPLAMLQQFEGIGGGGRALIGNLVGEDEVLALTLRNDEIADRPHPLAAHRDVAAQDQHGSAGDQRQGAILQAADPGYGDPVIETHRELASHLEVAFQSFDDADNPRMTGFRRHEISD